MPELPEVETIKRSLAKVLPGKKIKNIEVRKPKIFQGDPKEAIGKTIRSIERRGKILIMSLGDVSLLIHLKLTGQLIYHLVPFAGETFPAKNTHVVFEIDHGKLFYNDLRQFGWIKIVKSSKLKVQNEIERLGPEPFDKEFTVDYLQKIFLKTSKSIKLVLMDQEKIAGLGNIYANEALFEAGILPARPADSLRAEETKELREGILGVLEEGLKFGGASAADEAYVKPDGGPGSYQKHFRVYQREGKDCLRCGHTILRINLAGRGTFFCPNCQK